MVDAGIGNFEKCTDYGLASRLEGMGLAAAMPCTTTMSKIKRE